MELKGGDAVRYDDNNHANDDVGITYAFYLKHITRPGFYEPKMQSVIQVMQLMTYKNGLLGEKAPACLCMVRPKGSRSPATGGTGAAASCGVARAASRDDRERPTVPLGRAQSRRTVPLSCFSAGLRALAATGLTIGCFDCMRPKRRGECYCRPHIHDTTRRALGQERQGLPGAAGM